MHDWLHDDRRKWVLILDNVDDAGFLFDNPIDIQSQPNSSGLTSRPLRDYLPQSQNGSVLITSRSREAARQLVEERDIIAVGPMDEQHALALFNAKLGTQSEGQDVSELMAALEYMPLAIVQAATYVNQRSPRSSVRQYLEDFHRSDRRRMNLLDKDGGQLRRDPEAKNSILITWQISFDHIRQSMPSAADLLSLMSFFDRQGIPEVLLRNQTKEDNEQEYQTSYRGSDTNEDDTNESHLVERDQFEDDILALRNFSFIYVNRDTLTFEMHGLVQLATRKWLEANGELEKWKDEYIRILYAEYPTAEYENWAICRMLFPHAQSAAAQRPLERKALLEWAANVYRAGWYARKKGNRAAAEKLSVKSAETRTKAPRPRT